MSTGALAEPFYLRYRGGAITLLGDSEPAFLTGVALVRGPGSKPQIVLIQERPVGTKGKMEHTHKLVATSGLEAPWIADGAALLLRGGPSTVHLKLQAKLVDAPDGQGALDAFASRLQSALDSGRLDAAAPTAESVLAAVHSVPVAKKARASFGGGFRPSSNLGKGPGSGLGSGGSLATASTQRHVPRIPIWGGAANRGAFQHGSARSSRMFDAAMGSDPPKRPSPYQLPAPAAAPHAPAPHKPPPSWPPPDHGAAARKQTPTHHQHQQPPLIRQQLLHPPASSSGSGSGSGSTRALPRLQQPAAASSGGGGGFKNMGNTCYINATLSALLAIRPFVRDLTRPSLADRLTPHLPPLSVYRALFGLAHDHESGGTSTPRHLKQAIAHRCSQFAGHEQQDAHEFLSDCLDLLHDELVSPNPNPNPDPSPSPSPSPSPYSNPNPNPNQAGAAKADAADEVTPPLADRGNGAASSAAAIGEHALPTALNFQCEVHHELTCLQCGKQWCRPEAMRDFSLELPAATGRGGGGLPRELPTIQTLLRTFFASEELEVGCEGCGHPRAKVEHRVAQLPRVLVLQLKRFEYGQAGVRKRLDAVRPVPSLSLGFCCDARTKPPPRVEPASHAPAAEAPAVAAAAAAAGARRISETDPATVRKKINFGQDVARDHAARDHAAPSPSPTRPTRLAAQQGGGGSSSSTAATTGGGGSGGGGGGGGKPPALTQTTLGDGRPSSKHEWKVRRQQEEDEFAAAIAASLADEQGGAAAAEVPPCLPTGGEGGEVVELDGLEDGDDEEAQVRRAVEASIREGELAASRRSAATPRATPPDTPTVVPPIAPSAAPPAALSAAPITAPPAAPPAAPHEQIDLTDDGGADAAARYSLCGVVWHTGSSAGAGHYVADVRQQLDRPAEWKRFNDAVVTTVSRDTVLQQEALSRGYIFFYVHSSAE